MPIKVLLSFALGAVIGLEREKNERTPQRKGSNITFATLGLRSFSLITLLGTLSGFAYVFNPLITGFIGLSLLMLMISFYILESLRTNNPGITTEIALIYSYLIGLFIALEVLPIQLILAITILLILLLSRKKQISTVIDDLRNKEINAFISYSIIALVILPFLPDKSFALLDIPGLKEFGTKLNLSNTALLTTEFINPFKLWFIVALITGIDIAGYILERTIGQKKGWLIASMIGGFISSTATTQSLVKQSKESGRVNHLLASAIFANLVSFVQIALLIGTINAVFLVKLAPVLLILVASGIILGTFFLKKKEKGSKKKELRTSSQNDAIFSLRPALNFAIIYLLISIFSKIGLALFGEGGFLITTALGALAGLDAVMINTANLFGEKVSDFIAVLAFILANIVNLSGKVLYSFLQGKREFTIKLAISFGIMVAASLLGLLFI